MALLLIGSTGNGKSALGNFLLDFPDSDCSEQTFRTARSNLPETQRVKNCTKTVKYSECQELDLSVIDTPGLNETPEKDLEHMIQIVEELQVIPSIRACVIVVKFENKIDAQYKQTLKHYKEIFPSLFERNVIVVMTGYAADEKSKRRRKQQGIDEEDMVANVKKEIMESGGISGDLMMFQIECVPDKEDKEELQTAIENRDAILDYIAQLEPFTQTTLKVAKSEYMVMRDNERIRELEDEIEKYKQQLKEKVASQRAKECLEEIGTHQKSIMNLEADTTRVSNELSDLDTTESVEGVVWSFDLQRGIFKAPTADYHIKSKSRIKHVSKWPDKTCTWRDELVSDREIKGTVAGKKMKALMTVRLVAYISKRDKYEDDIKALNDKHKELVRKLDSLKEKLKKIKDKHETEQREQNKELEAFIDGKSEIKSRLSKKFLTIPEAKLYLQELK